MAGEAGYELIVAEKTLSEKKLPFATEVQMKVVPYVDHYIQGTFVINKKEPLTGVTVLQINELKDAVPDPLNQNQNTTMKKIKDTACPKN